MPTPRRRSPLRPIIAIGLMVAFLPGCSSDGMAQQASTHVSIVGDQFHINGSPVYQGRTWTTSYGGSYPIEGLLMNARLVQGVFDDLNPETRGQWTYPDTKVWDPDRNTTEFLRGMDVWREHGLLSFTINLQGGCPYGYCRSQPWENSAFEPNGDLRPDFMNRMARVIEHADEIGMVVILGYFYFGQDDRLQDEAAVIRAVEGATTWVLEQGYTNVIIEINNECNIQYDHEILQCARVHELITLAKDIERDGRRLYVSTSLGGGSVPPGNIVAASDYVFLHGNGVRDPNRMIEMITQVREMDEYRPMPIVNNEDDQPWRVPEQGWEESGNNFVEAVKNYASWGYFDFRLEEEHGEYNLGYQGVPVNWQISSERKRDFFDLLAEITGSPGTPEVSVEWSPTEVGRATVHVDDTGLEVDVHRIEVEINNEVVATLNQAPFEFHIDDLPDGEHWVRARAFYHNGERDIAVESPYHRNPWWPYGGPVRP